MAMSNLTPFLASYNELIEQWQELTRILKGIEEKSVGFPELIRMIWVFRQSCVEFQKFQTKLDYFNAESPSGDLFGHWQELSSDFNKIRACFAALERSIDKYHHSRAMAKPSPLTPVDLFRPSADFPNIHDSRSNMAKMRGSRIIKKKPRKLIISIPVHTFEGSFFDGTKKARIVKREPGELTLILRVSKEYLSLNARPQVDMEEEMRLSVLRHQKAKEEEARKQAEAVIEAAQRAAFEKAESEVKLQAELEARLQVKIEAESQTKAQETQPQQVASHTLVDLNENITRNNCKRAFTDDGMPLPLSRVQAPDMEEIRVALITTTNQMYVSNKQTVKACAIKRRVRKQLQLDKNFFEENGWPKRCEIIILEAFKEAWCSELVGY
ncbi:uncharacterized protein EAE97_010352 [Botrytis byssoidea]|uniref:Uncharacterized protein n=1 Tax=Botrytis byssoidea TaxID=139641 RepID=A0A9P5LK74_9HELO|nr:uncharacterized protein EAE97_010352 [Botrytis byssoidea]KAF7926052.1 hypothetical protein EAE97_010352 [Botrytis byssoidea]